ncbi:DUF1109 domain-containing protein [Nocardia cyriacigeorgica]|uniref:DUF1109 domain-containing protein n=1 Tax=Nocardia cyriacigeorgica TaxID=135487 RepID=A0A6P1DCM5_9NOCA|nr:DUF1109 domain-containing protein [Nocardia cyriacigeorgica]NEW38680.1 DUF1109 domain-containing protein [Nocardia cyriacigeorgica]NEW46540.1 DUF1109 domain-containing protein [Nocardia cyriacigeorgica]NEW53412.1 DUF1109 domain-containing protein [Nocardia cyriacigeorgica]
MSNRERLGRALIDKGKPNRPPGPIHLAITIVAVVVLVCLYYDWWPSRYGSFGWADPLLFGAAAALWLFICGAVWAIRTLYVVGRGRTWSWWIAAAPAMILAVAGTVVLLPRPSFDDTRPQFERVALDLLVSSETSRSHLDIGRFDISYVRKDPDGAVYFIDGGGLGLTVSSGWAYSPHGTPVGFDDFTATHLDGPWYEFTAVWRD